MKGLSVICMRVVVICRCCFFYSINKPSQPQLALLPLFIPDFSRFLVVSRERERERRQLEEKIKERKERERENACNVMVYAAAVCVMYYVCMYVVSQKNGLKERYDAMLHYT